ncbi:hypothetical protein LR48_Vigan316s000900 [Vigna angularis]|uniref:Homeobox domain-containing protein n=1 Tax=Phaseolus angularis TaxID=3914 RepID=A0A0L9T848_PHAAN|nr:hypothetical protein LR48_Vigan316s000900 [Vigna angularis]
MFKNMMSEMEIERYTSQRWRPTDDQVKMMTNIFNYGVTHPSRAQIVEITSRLRTFGDASEYNVHCWFNNHGNRVRRCGSVLDLNTNSTSDGNSCCILDASGRCGAREEWMSVSCFKESVTSMCVVPTSHQRVGREYGAMLQ